MEQIDIAKRMVEEFSDDLQYCDTAACARAAFRSGRVGSFLGIEVRPLSASMGSTERALTDVLRVHTK